MTRLCPRCPGRLLQERGVRGRVLATCPACGYHEWRVGPGHMVETPKYGDLMPVKERFTTVAFNKMQREEDEKHDR